MQKQNGPRAAGHRGRAASAGRPPQSHREKSPEKSQVQVIARAAAILRALEEQPAGLSLGQISQRVDLARSTVQRIVAALAAEKLLIAASPTGRVRLGPTILRLAVSARTDFVALARPFLVELSSELNETVDLATIKKDHLIFVDQVIGPHRLRAVSAVGETFPLYCTANGKAYLAQLDEVAVARLIGDVTRGRCLTHERLLARVSERPVPLPDCIDSSVHSHDSYLEPGDRPSLTARTRIPPS